MEIKYKPTIGLEIHAELLTKTKMFCDCLNDDQELNPNINICPVCLGHPGALPKINEKAVEFVIKTGLALNCRINKDSKFDRKNYFYPDLPKAYQISQYDMPLCEEGFLVLPSNQKKIRITRIHLEEDTARLAHSVDRQSSLVDYNRSGVPLMELVTEPDFSCADDVVEFAKEFQLILRYLGVSDGDMEKGHMRVEANTSISDSQLLGKLGTKVEVKNLNSFKAVGRAINFEIQRQAEILDKGEKVKQETRGWDENKQETFSQRSKEQAHDYRYFPEPDLPPLKFTDEFIESIRKQIVDLPQGKRERLSSEYNLSNIQANILTEDLLLSDFFEEAVSELKVLDLGGNPEMIYNYLVSDVKGLEADRGISLAEAGFKPMYLAQIVYLISLDKISSRVAKDVIAKSFDTKRLPEDIINEENLWQMDDDLGLEEMVKSVIDENEKVCYDYKNGKENALQFLVGKVMAKSKGRANPEIIKTILKKII